MKKKAVITILGTIRHTKQDKDGKIIPKKDEEKALYYFSKDLLDKFKLSDLKKRYVNMFPLIIDTFSKEYEIKPIYTKQSKEIQQSLLDYKKIDFDIEKNGLFISENIDDKEAEYSYFLNKVNLLIKEYDSVIVDVTHGFRHFPILATINLIIENIQDPKKIEAIIFAKEIEQFKKYEIIDLLEYLELANLSYMLSTFNQNYTISNNISFKNRVYDDLSKELKNFSDHLLSNSLKHLIEGSMIDNILDSFKVLKQKEDIVDFKNFLIEIEKHLKEIKKLKEKKEFIRLYKISKMMDKRGYLLNAITLLFEATGFYCAEGIYQNTKNAKTHIEKYKQFIKEGKTPKYKFSSYTLTHQSKNLIKLNNYRGDYLFNPETINLSKNEVNRLRKQKEIPYKKINSIKKEIKDFKYSLDKKLLEEFIEFINDLEALRNNLSHGNSSEKIEDVKNEFSKLIVNFKNFCIEKNILKVNL